MMFFDRVAIERRGTRVVVVLLVDLLGFVAASFPLPLDSGAVFDLLFTALPVTSPKASRLRLPCGPASKVEDNLLGPPTELPAADAGFERAIFLVVLALAFSLSLTVMRVARVTRRVW